MQSNNGSNTASVFNTTNFLHNAVESEKRDFQNLNIKAITIGKVNGERKISDSEAINEVKP